MAKIKVGINGLGRIGRTVLREFINRNEQNFEIVAVNNPGVPSHYLHLLKYEWMKWKKRHRSSLL